MHQRSILQHIVALLSRLQGLGLRMENKGRGSALLQPSKMERQLRFMAIAMSVSLCSSVSISSQAPPLQQPAAVNTQALSLISQALSALGGTQAWQQVGGATAQVSLTRADGKAETIQWSDDWHLGYVQARRDSLSGSSSGASMITQQNGRVFTSPGLTSRALPRENDLTLLAVGYPAAALAQSIAGNACSFYLGSISSIDPSPLSRASSASDIKIEEICSDRTMPTGKARLTWVLSKSSSLPVAVQLPVRGLLHNSVQYETVVYSVYQQIQGLTVPAKLAITRPDGSTDHLSITSTSFATALPSTLFQAGQ